MKSDGDEARGIFILQLELLTVRQAVSCNLNRSGRLYGAWRWLLLLPWMIGGACLAANQEAKSDAPMLSAEQRKQVQQMLGEYRGLRGLPGAMEKRAKLATEILLVSDAAAPMLATVVENEAAAALTQYENSLLMQGSAALKAELAKPGVREKVAELRHKIRDTTRLKDLSTKLIESDIDPALKELGQILLIDPAKLADATPALKTLRLELLQMEKQQESCLEIFKNHPKLKLAAGQSTREIGKLMKDREQAVRFGSQELDAADKKTLAANRQLAGKLEKEEEAGLWELNQMRMLMGLSLLKVDLKLSAAARDHSTDMKEKNFFDHTSPVPGKKTYIQRARKFGALALGENIHQGSDRGADAIEGWHHSPGHHKNMFSDDFGSVGLGRSGDYWTQMFGK